MSGTESLLRGSARPSGAELDLLRSIDGVQIPKDLDETTEVNETKRQPQSSQVQENQRKIRENVDINDSCLTENVAITPYGPVKTFTAEEAEAIEYLRRPSQYRWKEQNAERFRSVEEQFIRQWKLINVGKPLKHMSPSEMKWLYNQENVIQMYSQSSCVRNEIVQDKSTTFFTDHGPIGIFDIYVVHAVKWLHTNSREASRTIEETLIGPLAVYVKELLNIEKRFLDKYSQANLDGPGEDVDPVILAFVKEKLRERKVSAERLRENNTVAGTPACKEERAICTYILGLEQKLHRHLTEFYATVDGKSLNIFNNEQAAAIQWLNSPENLQTVSETKKKIVEEKPLFAIDMLIQKKMALERTFVKDFTLKYWHRTDFELNVLLPNELAFVKRKEKEFMEEDNAKELADIHRKTIAAPKRPTVPAEDVQSTSTETKDRAIATPEVEEEIKSVAGIVTDDELYSAELTPSTSPLVHIDSDDLDSN